MSQASAPTVERRTEARNPAAFAFWYEPTPSQRRASAWMLNISRRGAAFLASADSAPSVGQRLRLSEMFSTDRVVREGSMRLPPFARVLRVEDAVGVTCRVAVQFEADKAAPLETRKKGRFVVTRFEPQLPPPPPPGASSDDESAAPALLTTV